MPYWNGRRVYRRPYRHYRGGPLYRYPYYCDPFYDPYCTSPYTVPSTVVVTSPNAVTAPLTEPIVEGLDGTYINQYKWWIISIIILIIILCLCKYIF